MGREIATYDEDNDYLGFTGELPVIHEYIRRLYENRIMTPYDWKRAEALAELEGFEPEEEKLIERIQNMRMSCLIEIERKIAPILPLT